MVVFRIWQYTPGEYQDCRAFSKLVVPKRNTTLVKINFQAVAKTALSNVEPVTQEIQTEIATTLKRAFFDTGWKLILTRVGGL